MASSIHGQSSWLKPAAQRIKQETARSCQAQARLLQFLQRWRTEGRVKDFGQFEKELHAHVTQLERELLAEELERSDVDQAEVLVDGRIYRRVMRAEQTYFTACGPVRVERTLFKDRTDPHARTLCPLELRIGIVEGLWTPQAAQQASWVVAQMTPKLGEELFRRVGNMTPSKSSLDRLPKQLSARYEQQREQFERQLRVEESVPEDAVTVSVSLDGVMAPMADGDSVEKRAQTAAQGRQTRGPAGYREVGCATMSFFDSTGELLHAVRMGRMPEPKKSTLKSMLTAELGQALAERPDLTVVALADGAKDNWDYLQREVLDRLPAPMRCVGILDFYHATEHLSTALGAAYGDGSVKARTTFIKHRATLLQEPAGVDKVIRALVHLRSRHPRNDKIASTLKYFRANKERMAYATYREEGLPVGSGVVEAACKTLVTQRMKNSGMRWTQQGGQAVLTLRSFTQSDRFDRAWALLAATYKVDLQLVSSVIPLRKYQ